MKWNILLGTVVLGFGLCTQSYGFELLDRMLGVGGGGDCCQKDHVQDGKCGCDQKGHSQKSHAQKGHEQKCGCGGGGLFGHLQKGGKGCAQKDDCAQKKGHEQKCCGGGGLFGHLQKGGKGCAQKDDCAQKKGHEQKCGCGGGLFGHSQKGCAQKDGCAQKKGCAQKESKGCCQKSGHSMPDLFGSLFGHGKGKGKKGKCDTAEDYKSDKVDDVKAPMPPAPVVDPSAYLQTRRPVVQASVTLR